MCIAVPLELPTSIEEVRCVPWNTQATPPLSKSPFKTRFRPPLGRTSTAASNHSRSPNKKICSHSTIAMTHLSSRPDASIVYHPHFPGTLLAAHDCASIPYESNTRRSCDEPPPSASILNAPQAP